MTPAELARLLAVVIAVGLIVSVATAYAVVGAAAVVARLRRRPP